MSQKNAENSRVAPSYGRNGSRGGGGIHAQLPPGQNLTDGVNRLGPKGSLLGDPNPNPHPAATPTSATQEVTQLRHVHQFESDSILLHTHITSMKVLPPSPPAPPPLLLPLASLKQLIRTTRRGGEQPTHTLHSTHPAASLSTQHTGECSPYQTRRARPAALRRP